MRSYTKKFNNPENYEKLITFLNDGKSYVYIGEYFGVDHTSVIYHARKLGIGKGRHIIPTKPVYKGKRTLLENYLMGERINNGKRSYLEYIKEEEGRVGHRIKLPPIRIRYKAVMLDGYFTQF